MAESCQGGLYRINADGTVQNILTLSSLAGSEEISITIDPRGDAYIVGARSPNLYELVADAGIEIIATGFSAPRAVAADADGSVFVADQCGLARVPPSGGPPTWITGGTGPACANLVPGFATALAFAPSGNLYAVASIRQESEPAFGTVFLRISPDGGVSTIASMNLCSLFSGLGLAVTATDIFFSGGSSEGSWAAPNNDGWVGALHLSHGTF
ncbi:MAG: SMP-30/gluconolactonase/LRE family protein [Myxococcales bacterium]